MGQIEMANISESVPHFIELYTTNIFAQCNFELHTQCKEVLGFETQGNSMSHAHYSIVLPNFKNHTFPRQTHSILHTRNFISLQAQIAIIVRANLYFL